MAKSEDGRYYADVDDPDGYYQGPVAKNVLRMWRNDYANRYWTKDEDEPDDASLIRHMPKATETPTPVPEHTGQYRDIPLRGPQIDSETNSGVTPSQDLSEPLSTGERLCACGCGEPVPEHKKYSSATHRYRAAKRRKRQEEALAAFAEQMKKGWK